MLGFMARYWVLRYKHTSSVTAHVVNLGMHHVIMAGAVMSARMGNPDKAFAAESV